MNKIRLYLYASVVFISIYSQAGIAVEASDAAKSMLNELSIKASALPIKEDRNWKKPERIILVSSYTAASIDNKLITDLESAADGAELIIVGNLEEAREKIEKADVLLGSCSQAHSGMTQLRWMQHFSAGVESCVGNAVYSKNRVLLTSMKGVYGPGIAEHAIAMMFSLSRGLHQFHSQQLLGKWNQGLAREYPMQELKGKTMLVVGLGGIGSEIARRANALGMRVVATRNSSREKPDFVEYVGLANELAALAGQADVIVNATPLTKSTTGLFDSEFFALLKSSAYFINISRGKSVITADLVTALKAGKLDGAALDVVDPEPLPVDHVLW